MSEKLCLQWNEFQKNMKEAFRKLREDKNFTDVTLACKDGQQLEAHKVILVASSPFFKKLLERNKHPHPLIYMRGLKSEDLLAIIDFLYCAHRSGAGIKISKKMTTKGTLTFFLRRLFLFARLS